MGKFYDDIPLSFFEWIRKQEVFWVATAPLINSRQVWYEDLTGSGVETISHIRENGRITIMFCAFEGPPRILRIFGIGTVHEYGSAEYNGLIPAATRKPGSRAAIVIDIYQVGSSCGYAVPLYEFVRHRTQLLRSNDKQEVAERMLAASRDRENGSDKKSTAPLPLRAYWLLENVKSLDGLPGLLTAPDAILSMPPQSHYDKDGPRPMLRRKTDVAHRTRDFKWLVTGFMLGAVTVLSVTKLVGRLRE